MEKQKYCEINCELTALMQKLNVASDFNTLNIIFNAASSENKFWD